MKKPKNSKQIYFIFPKISSFYYSNIYYKNYNTLVNENNALNNSFKMYNNIEKIKIGFKKDKIKYLYLNPDDLNYKVFSENLLDMNYVDKEKNYAFLIKIKKLDGFYSMAGYHQI